MHQQQKGWATLRGFGCSQHRSLETPTSWTTETQCEASTAAQRGFNRFARRYPHLAEQVRRNLGRSSRNSYARETGGRRVVHEGLEPVDEDATQTASEEVLERIRQDLRSETDEDQTVFVDGVLEEDGSSSSVGAHASHQDRGWKGSDKTPGGSRHRDPRGQPDRVLRSNADSRTNKRVVQRRRRRNRGGRRAGHRRKRAARGCWGRLRWSWAGAVRRQLLFVQLQYRVVQYVKGELFELVSRKGSLGALRALPRELQVPAQRVAQLGRLGSLRTRIRLSPRLVNRRVTPCCSWV